MLKVIKRVVTVPVFVMIRPRGGDFLYDEHEFAVMKEDVKTLKEAGCDGLVFGILSKYGTGSTAVTCTCQGVLSSLGLLPLQKWIS